MTTHYTYYSEYSIDSWIKLVLNSEITLPPYQRSFVWKTPQAYKLVKAIRYGNFVPPVTIISTQHDYSEMKKGLYLIDGQQRLSAILLFYLGVWPNPAVVSYETSSAQEHDDDYEYESMPWTFGMLQNEYSKHTSFNRFKEVILSNKQYIDIKDTIDREKNMSKKQKSEAHKFVESLKEDKCANLLKKALGYSFVRSVACKKDEKRLFANLFRDINTSGTRLSNAESRNAMYYLEPELKELFRPDFLQDYRIGNSPIDFPRYMSYVEELYNNYNQNGGYINVSRIAYGYSNKPEDYILKYIVDKMESYSNSELHFRDNMVVFRDAFLNIFKDKVIKDMPNFEIMAYGLIFWVLLHGKSIDTTNINLVEDKFKSYFENNYNPSKRVGGIRDRLEVSVNAYKELLI